MIQLAVGGGGVVLALVVANIFIFLGFSALASSLGYCCTGLAILL